MKNLLLLLLILALPAGSWAQEPDDGVEAPAGDLSLEMLATEERTIVLFATTGSVGRHRVNLEAVLGDERPVTVAREHLSKGKVRYLLINSGNANAGTGQSGIDSALACARAVATRAGVPVAEVLPFSTGVIGEPLPVELITAAVPRTPELSMTSG